MNMAVPVNKVEAIGDLLGKGPNEKQSSIQVFDWPMKKPIVGLDFFTPEELA
jgi:hypothetical protein